jgi:hypothetical protein
MTPVFVGDLKTPVGRVDARDDRRRPQLTRTRYGLCARRPKVKQLAPLRVDQPAGQRLLGEGESRDRFPSVTRKKAR